MNTPRHAIPGIMSGRSTSHAETIRHCLALIDGSADRAIFTRLYRDTALAEAEAIDRAPGLAPGPLTALPISIKDLFDVAGEATTAGSPMLGDNPPAIADAPVVARLRTAGAIVLGKTNMSELAYSGLGLNPHFGTPRNAIDPDRLPGGSSAGAGVAVALGLSAASIGSDTGGSIRIPAAFNGVVGFKPTQARISRAGMVGLSTSQDTVGPLTRTVAGCALLDAVMAGTPTPELTRRDLKGLRIGVPTRFLTDDLDPEVAQAFEAAVRILAKAGAQIVETPCHEINLVVDVIAEGGLVGPEAYRAHQHLLASPDRLDPHVRMQIERFANHPIENYRRALGARVRAQAGFARLMDLCDVLACPTVASVPPRLTELSDEDATLRINRRVLRNTSPFNILDVPAVTMPCHEPGTLPVGLMLVGRHLQDGTLLAIAHRAEFALARRVRGDVPIRGDTLFT